MCSSPLKTSALIHNLNEIMYRSSETALVFALSKLSRGGALN